MARNVLTLSTLTERATITVNDVPYELLNAGELSVVDNHRVGKWGARVQELHTELENRSEEEIAEVASLLDLLCRVIFRAPAEVHDKLTDSQRLLVAQAFIALQRGTLPVPAGASEEPVPPQSDSSPGMSTGAKS